MKRRAEFFRTYTWSPKMGPPGYEWSYVLRRHARWLAVHLIGATDWIAGHKRGDLRGWEDASWALVRATGECPDSHRVAYMMVNLHQRVILPTHHFNDTTDARLVDACRAAFLWVRGNFPYRVAVFADDFIARAFVLSGLRADLLILDNPMLRPAELAGTLAERTNGYVRSSATPWSSWADRTTLREGDVVRGIESAGVHGCWARHRLLARELEAVRRPLVESLTP